MLPLDGGCFRVLWCSGCPYEVPKRAKGLLQNSGWPAQLLFSWFRGTLRGYFEWVISCARGAEEVGGSWYVDMIRYLIG